GVVVACQLGRRAGTKFVAARQGKRRDLRPLREIRCREIGWCQLVASRLDSRNERRRRDARSVIASQGQDLSRNGLSYRDAISLILPIRNLRQVLLKLGVECRLKSWRERNQQVMGGLLCRSESGSTQRDVWEANQAWLTHAVDRVNCV